MPNEALLFKSSGRLFHILRSAYDGRYSNEPVFKMYLNFRENCLVPIICTGILKTFILNTFFNSDLF